MKKIILFICFVIISLSINAQTSWDGGGDGSSWDDPQNWSDNLVPSDTSDITFPQNLNLTLTSSVSTNTAARITIDTNTIVILELDLTIVDTTSLISCISVKDSATLQLGSGTTAHTFVFGCEFGKDPVAVRGDMSELIISSMATVDVISGLNNLRITNPNALITNNGTINISGYKTRGINVGSGTFTNNGTINISVGRTTSNDGIHMPSGAVFNNGVNGVVTITKVNDDAINIVGTLNNEGLINFFVKDAATAANIGIVIGTNSGAGVLNNMSTGIINGNVGLSAVGRGIYCRGAGTLNNDGLLSLTNGNPNERLDNEGTIVNNACAEINVNDGLLLNSGGTFTNNGLLTGNSSINNTAGTVTNNGFYAYSSAPIDTFGTGAGTSIDNGLTAFATVDAQNSCTVSDIGIDVMADWYSDALGQNLVGTSDASGTLVFLDTVFNTSGTDTLYTCYGAAVTLTVDNIDGNCVVLPPVVVNVETIWDGGGDGSSWDDPINWSSDLVPGDTSHVIFPKDLNVTITSSVSNNTAERITVDTNSTVILELDLTILDTNSTNNCIIVLDSSTLQLGSGTTAYTFALGCALNRDVVSVRGEMSEFIISSMSTVHLTSGLHCLRTTKATALLTNNGTVNISGYNSRGINISSGTMTNNGTININVGKTSSNDGIHIPSGSVFNNGVNGVVTITKVNDDAINIFGTFNNEGLLNFVVKDAATAANVGIVIGNGSAAGVLNNMNTGIINGDIGLSTIGRGIHCGGAGTLNNDGLISLDNGNSSERILNTGTVVNNVCAEITVNDGLLLNDGGTFTNNGLFTADSSINNTAGTVTNNGFYSYSSAPIDTFGTGAGTSIDNGLTAVVTIDAQGSCDISDIGIDVAADWYSDALGQNLVGTNDASGNLVFLDTIFSTSGTHTLYTCYGSAVALTLDSIDGNCIVSQSPVNLSGDIVWDGGGDGTSWDDPINWSNDLVPVDTSNVVFPRDLTVTVTSSVSNNTAASITVDTNSVVNLELDLTILDTTSLVSCISVKDSSTLQLGSGTTASTFVFGCDYSKDPVVVRGNMSELIISSMATVDVTSGLNNIRITNPNALITNNGTLNVLGYKTRGINVGAGTFANNGNLNISVGRTTSNDGIHMPSGAVFNNGVNGVVTITKVNDDAINIVGTLNNDGLINFVVKDTAIAANVGILIGSGSAAGVLNNTSTGVINGNIGLSTVGIGIHCKGAGTLNNDGLISLTNGNSNERLNNEGTVVNNACAEINVNDGLLFNNGGTFTNDGLLTGSSSIDNTAGTVTNNGFYAYTSPNDPFGTGAGTSTDNGLAAFATIDAQGACTLSGIGIATDWYTDTLGQNLVGTSDVSGNLVFLDTIFATSGPYILHTTCYGSAVAVTVNNISGNCVVGQPPVVSGESIWDGGGDGTSWDDPINWTNDLVPGDTSDVIFPKNLNVIVTSSVSNNTAASIIVDTNSVVNLELDLTIFDTTSLVTCISVKDSSTLQLGSGTTAYTFVFGCEFSKDPVVVRGDMSELIISSMSTVDVTSGSNNLRITNPNALITNNGTINISGYKTRGINVGSGTFANDGTINISTGRTTSNDGIHMPSGAIFNNGVNGIITITKVNDDAINIVGTLNNDGLINFVVKDTATAANVGILIGTGSAAGVLNNMSTGIINGDVGLSTVGIGIHCKGAGTLTNDGLISLTNGNSNERLNNEGTIVNNACAEINLNNGLLLNDGGTFTNDGLFTGNSSIDNTAGTVTNNGFYAYASTSDPFGNGAGTTTDNGLAAFATIDAINSCTISNIGIDVAADWYSDTLGQNLVGTSDVSGTLVFLDTIFSTSGTHTLYTCYGSAVALTFDNIAGGCIVGQTGGNNNGLETIWDGGGDGLSWDDPLNWSGDFVPNQTNHAIFPSDLNVTVTSSVSTNAAERITIDTNSTVILELDLTILDTNSTESCLIVLDSSTVQLGSATTAYTFALGCLNKDVISITGELSECTISSMATVNITSGLNGIRTTNANALVTNNGTLNLEGYTSRGIRESAGTITNNGTIDIKTGNSTNHDGIDVSSGATFNNGVNGVIFITKTSDDAINIVGTFNNEGLINFTVKDSATAANVGIVVGTGGVVGILNNMSTGTITGDGGPNVLSRDISCRGAGIINNDGVISLTGGNPSTRFSNQGTTVNSACAEINVNDGLFFNNNGTFTNDGLITGTGAGSSIDNASGTATNNGFYAYLSPTDPFATGAGTTIDNGLSASATVNALNSCTISDIGIDVAADWYSDPLGQNLVGSSDASGTLTFIDNIFSIPGTHTLYTCYGSAVALTFNNIEGNCVVPQPGVNISVSVNLSEYTGTFTTVYISGEFNNWSGTANPLTHQGNSVWSGTISAPFNDSIEYKFTLDDWNGQELFNGGESCTKTTGNFTNRFLAYGNSDMTLDPVCWESCNDCTNSTHNTILTAAFEMIPNPANDFLQLSFDGAFIATEKTLFVRNAVGQLVYSSTINHVDKYELNTGEFSSGLYFITIQTEKGVQTKRLLVSHN